jgi:hypothetical protein
MGRCLSPCLGDLDPNLYRRRLDRALALFTGRGDAGAALLEHVDAEMREAAAAQRFERAAWLRRRRERLAWLLKALGGAVGATHARPRLVLAEHPRGGRWDAFWLVGGRVADWRPLAGLEEMVARTEASLRGNAGTARAASLTAEEVDEARMVATWLDRVPSPSLDLATPPSRERLASFIGVVAPDAPAAAPGPVPGPLAVAVGTPAAGSQPPPGTLALDPPAPPRAAAAQPAGQQGLFELDEGAPPPATPAPALAAAPAAPEALLPEIPPAGAAPRRRRPVRELPAQGPAPARV